MDFDSDELSDEDFIPVRLKEKNSAWTGFQSSPMRQCDKPSLSDGETQNRLGRLTYLALPWLSIQREFR